jgi:dsDNA-specific endonuclease/ATPase MutS2
MKRFNVGDRVQLLDELTQGVVVWAGPGRLRILTPEGFELEVEADAVVAQPGAGEIPVDQAALAAALEAEHRPVKKPQSPRRGRTVPPMEVDLHIDKLLNDTRGMSAGDILDYQLRTARGQLEFAIRKRLQRLVFIHGVGEGVLREELYTLIRRYPGLRYQDADYRTYGMGATEVYIPQDAHL